MFCYVTVIPWKSHLAVVILKITSRNKRITKWIDSLLIFAVWHGLAMLHDILMFVIMHVRNICFEILNILRNINSLCKSTEKHSQILVNVYEIRNNHERRICIEISAINHFIVSFLYVCMVNTIYLFIALWKHHVNLLLQSFRSVSSDLHQYY